MLYRRDGSGPYKQSELFLNSHDGTLICTLFAKGDKKPIGYKAKRGSKPVDLTARGLDPRQYFEPVYAIRIAGTNEWFVHLIKGEYYLLSTNELVDVPEFLCAELRALDPRLGLFFSHFAGFIDPGWFGSVTLEVLAPHNMVLRHGDPVARFVFEKMRGETPSYKQMGTYNGQMGTRLPKQFADWDE